MTEVLTAGEMRRRETRAMERGGVSGADLMALAGRGVVDAVFERWPALAWQPHRAIVLCGPGNNGGDGFVVARLLADRGWHVRLWLYGDLARVPPDARLHAARWADVGETLPWSDDGPDVGRADLVVDALFGGGLSRPLPEVISRLSEVWQPDRTVAVDAPSGLCLDSGRALGTALPAALTVTFQRPRLGHHLATGPSFSGDLAVVDIGLDAWMDDPDESPVRLSVAAPLRLEAAGHKYHHGHVMVLSGGVGRGGAARLAAEAALRGGAGLVTIGCPPAALIENAAACGAVMVAAIPDETALRRQIEDRKIASIVIGPGFGVGTRLTRLLDAVLGTGLPAVIDADALTLSAAEPETLFRQVNPACVLTPHDGEFARLFPDLARGLRTPPVSGPAFSRVDAARVAADRAGCTVLLKGPDTVIAAPEGAVVLNAATYRDSVPWLATAGAGDVLAGLVATGLAAGHPAPEAAAAAARLHTDAARHAGPGLTADDLPRAVSAVLTARLAT